MQWRVQGGSSQQLKLVVGRAEFVAASLAQVKSFPRVMNCRRIFRTL
jgi:hypothetical protein